MIKNIAHSIKVRLLNESDHDNRRYQQLLVRYMQERFLYRLSHSKFSNHLILKGGALLYAYDEFLPRPTLDVDFLGKDISNDKEYLIKIFKDIACDNTPNDGVIFDSDSVTATDIALDRKYPGVRIAIIGFVDTVRKELTFDVGFGDIITPKSCKNGISYNNSRYGTSIAIGILFGTVVAEKFQTIVEKNVFNSRMKDFFDLYRIIIARSFDEYTLLSAIRATLDNRGTDYSEIQIILSQEFASDNVLEKRWNAFCKKLRIADAPNFIEIMGVITTFITPYCNKLL
ncbi:MAG: nucleotidyl transferase AbiEii/AbiGii toxin family protein [Muribaculaceae bacterium]